MEIFEFEDYKDFTTRFVKNMPKAGYGQYRKIAEKLNTSTVIISQIFRGERHLNLDQAYDLAVYFELTTTERQYYLLMVEKARAATKRLQEHILAQMRIMQKQARDLKHRFDKASELSENAKAIFYSNWYYSGIRLLSSLDDFNEVEKIASRLSLPRQLVRDVINFLIREGLCISENGKLKMGPTHLHLDAMSPFIKSRQISWRLKAMEHMDAKDQEKLLFYTAPMSMAKELLPEIRQELIQCIEKINKKVAPSDEEELACLNIDFFKF